jgi:hypothetical protein
MNMTTSILRISALIALFTVAFIGILSVPYDDSKTWFSDFIWSKLIGFAAAYACGTLYVKWRKTDKLIAAYDKWSEKGLEDEI